MSSDYAMAYTILALAIYGAGELVERGCKFARKKFKKKKPDAPDDRSRYSFKISAEEIQNDTENGRWATFSGAIGRLRVGECTFPPRTEVKFEFHVRKDDEATLLLVGGDE